MDKLADVLQLDPAKRRQAKPAARPRFPAAGVLDPAEARALMLNDAGVPARYHGDAPLAEWGPAAQRKRQRQVLEFLRDYSRRLPEVISTGECLILTGPVGTGKTHIACSLVRQALLRHQQSAAYVTAMGLVSRIRECWGAEMPDAPEYEILASRALLVIDELGVQMGSDSERMILSRVIDDRYNQQRATVICSNYPADRLHEWLTERGVSRLGEHGHAVALDWGDYRTQGAK